MNAMEKMRKYLPLLTSGRITKEQYEFVLKIGERQVVSEAQPNVIQEQPEFQSATQKQRLYNLLSDRLWHDTVEIMDKVYSIEEKKGICRIGARVYDLKKDGHEIESRRKVGSETVWEYRLS